MPNFLADLLEEPSNREFYTKYLISIACLFAIKIIAILANVKKLMRSKICLINYALLSFLKVYLLWTLGNVYRAIG